MQVMPQGLSKATEELRLWQRSLAGTAQKLTPSNWLISGCVVKEMATG
jgi:hypothetical protein